MNNGELEFKPKADTELKAYAQQDLHISGIENKGYDDPQKAIDSALADQDNIQKVSSGKYYVFACWELHVFILCSSLLIESSNHRFKQSLN